MSRILGFALVLLAAMVGTKDVQAASAKDFLGEHTEVVTTRIVAQDFKCDGWANIRVKAQGDGRYYLSRDLKPVETGFRPWSSRQFEDEDLDTNPDLRLLTIPGVRQIYCVNHDSNSEIEAIAYNDLVYTVSVYYTACKNILNCTYTPNDLGNSVAERVNKIYDTAVDGTHYSNISEMSMKLMDVVDDPVDFAIVAMSFIEESAGCDRWRRLENAVCMVAAERDGKIFTAYSVARYGGLWDRLKGDSYLKGMSVGYSNIETELEVGRIAAPIVNEGIRLQLEETAAKQAIEAEKKAIEAKKKTAGFD